MNPLNLDFKEQIKKFMTKCYCCFGLLILVKKGRLYSDFLDIIQLQSLNGLNLGDTYCNDKAAGEFAKTISEMF